MKTDRRRLPAFTESDYAEIYYALETKEKLLRDGLYGRDREARRWRKHLAKIRQKILHAGIRV